MVTKIIILCLAATFVLTFVGFPFGVSTKDWGEGPYPPGGNIYLVTFLGQTIYEGPLTLYALPFYIVVFTLNLIVVCIVYVILHTLRKGKGEA